jgi:hypothetical protein
MIEPTQEFIKKVVENHFDVVEVDIGLVTMKFYFEDQDFKEKFVRLTQELETNNLLCTIEKEGYRHMVVSNSCVNRTNFSLKSWSSK